VARVERLVRRVTTSTIIELALGLMLVGCGGPSDEERIPSGPVTSEHGLYVADLGFEPNPPSVGENALAVWLEAGGEPVSNATVEVETYMPAHGHLNVAGSMTTLEPGSYRSENVVYNMPGTWQLTLKIAAVDGSDQVVVDYEVR
jgi:hypothetical protein